MVIIVLNNWIIGYVQCAEAIWTGQTNITLELDQEQTHFIYLYSRQKYSELVLNAGSGGKDNLHVYTTYIIFCFQA